MCQRLARLPGWVLELPSADMSMMQHQLQRSGKVHAGSASAADQAAVNCSQLAYRGRSS